MNLNDLLRRDNIDPKQVIALRHRPREEELRKWLPWLAAQKPEVFNAYQQTQGARLQKILQSLVGAGYVASFIGREAGRAVFVGLYSIQSARPLTYSEYWSIPANVELQTYGHGEYGNQTGWTPLLLWFGLVLGPFCDSWRGKLIVDWPPPEISWWRWAHRNELKVHAILEDSILDAKLPKWYELTLTWDRLQNLPTQWKLALEQWRGIYYVFDDSIRKGYVGSAYGDENIFGRWSAWAATGDGGNKLLRQRDPSHFHFSILQLVAPNEDPVEVIRLENSWKERLHTRDPLGLNAN